MGDCAFQISGLRPPSSLSHRRVNPWRCKTWRCAAQPPRRIGAVARDMQGALQDALRARVSRAAIELPPGARLGTEKRDSETSPRAAGDRELCRVLAAMFEGTGLSVHVVFSSPGLLKAAKKLWGPLIEFSVGTWDDISGKAKQGKKGGFGKSKGKAQLGDDIDVLLVVAPTTAQMGKVRLLGEQWGMDKLIILLNCDVDGAKTPVHFAKYINSEFEKVYFYRPNPHPKWSGGVLFRKFPDDWVLCRQTPMGLLKEILATEEQPSMEEIEVALKREGKDSATGIWNKLSSFLNKD